MTAQDSVQMLRFAKTIPLSKTYRATNQGRDPTVSRPWPVSYLPIPSNHQASTLNKAAKPLIAAVNYLFSESFDCC